ncbi:unnamed protein product [Closterium sp. NIES-54]
MWPGGSTVPDSTAPADSSSLPSPPSLASVLPSASPTNGSNSAALGGAGAATAAVVPVASYEVAQRELTFLINASAPVSSIRQGTIVVNGTDGARVEW